MTTGPNGMPDGYSAPYGSESSGSGYGTPNSDYGAPQYQNPQYENPQYDNPRYAEPSYAEPPYTNPTPQQPYPAPPQPYYAVPAPVPYGAPPVPSLAATILVTFFFGLFGLIPAAVHSQRATQLGQDGSRYWKAFGITFGIEIGLTVLVYVLIFVGAAFYVSS